MRCSAPLSLWTSVILFVFGYAAAISGSCYQDDVPWEGTMNWTVSGRQCQNWGVDFPHKHPHSFHNMSMHRADNYCRMPGLGFKSPWCYTTDPSVEWEICPVPKCPRGEDDIYGGTPTKLPTLTTPCYKESNMYYGQLSQTLSGRHCQYWDTQEPHQHNMTDPYAFPDDSIREARNYCRDPDNKGFPWCYTTDPNVRYEPCNVPSCGSGDCFDDSREYMGTISHTMAGVECSRWDGRMNPYPDRFFPDGSAMAANNYCRDPDGSGAPWCFTVMGNWAYCPVPRCHVQSCYTNSRMWNGKVSHTISGRTCQKWIRHSPHNHTFDSPNDFPDQSLKDVENYCRDPDGYGTPWCFTTDPDVQWEKCAVQQCSREHCWSGNSMEYKGTVSHTMGGIRCQAWAVQTPHRHSVIDSPEESLVEARNYCRDADGKGAPWCYTVDRRVVWDFCPIPRCPHYKKEPRT